MKVLIHIYKKLSSKLRFHENWLSGSHALLKDIKEFLPALSILLRFG